MPVALLGREKGVLFQRIRVAALPHPQTSCLLDWHGGTRAHPALSLEEDWVGSSSPAGAAVFRFVLCFFSPAVVSLAALHRGFSHTSSRRSAPLAIQAENMACPLGAGNRQPVDNGNPSLGECFVGKFISGPPPRHQILPIRAFGNPLSSTQHFLDLRIL